MYTVNATELKNRLGPVLARAELEPVAIVRHGRIVAHLVPVRPATAAPVTAKPRAAHGLSRSAEARLVSLCASGDLRPSRWMQAGDPEMLAGVATMLASGPGFDRLRLLALAERLSPGMTSAERFGRWLERAPVKAARLFPMVRAEMGRSAR